MRLIDADALLEILNKEKIQYDSDVNYFITHAPTVDAVPLEDYKSMERTVNKLTKAIADAVEVVRCKDCKFSHMTYGGECKSCDMWKDDDDFTMTLYLDGDFYCAFAERREDENN